MHLRTAMPHSTLAPLALLALAAPLAAHAGPADLEALAPAVRWVDQSGGYWPDQRYVAGDFDGDGLGDIARIYGGPQGTAVDVFRGDGAGLAWTRWTDTGGGFAVGHHYLAGDLDGDGDDDLIRVFDDGGLASIDGLISDGSHFTYSRLATRQGGFWASTHFVAADFDGDGADDVGRIFDDVGATSVDVFRHGGPTFERWMTRTGGFWDGMRFAAGDVDGDGRADITRLYDDGGAATVDLLHSTGAGFTHLQAMTRSGPIAPGTRSLMGDLDGDGRADVLLVDQDRGLRADALLSTGLAFDRHRLLRGAGPGDAHVLADFDGDGKAELAAVQGQFGLANIDVYGVAAPGWEYRARAVRWAGGSGGFWDSQIYLEGDFDGDGMPDVARVFADGGLTTVDVHHNTADGFEYQRWATQQGGHWDGMRFVSGDFTGDGRDDIVKVFDDGGLTSMDVFVAQVNGTFVFHRWITRSGGHWDGMKFIAGDFDGDGRADVAKIFGESGATSVDVFRSAGDHFPGFNRWMTRAGGFWDAQQYLTGDFDGDGRDDIARVFGGGQTSIDLLRSSGADFQQARWLTEQFPWADDQRHVAGDFDGDGLDDVVKIYPTPEGRVGMRLYHNVGGAFTSAHLTDDRTGFSPSGRVLAADFDLDGRAEVAMIYRTEASALTDFDVYGGETSPDPRFISTPGDPRRRSPAEAVAALAGQGFALVARSDLIAGECTVVYPNADALTQSRDLGLLTCAVSIGDDVQLRFTPIYGGCDFGAGADGAGAQCGIGIFAASVTVQIGPVQTEVEIQGPSAELCGSVSREAVCADVGANLWASSFLVTDGDGNGGGAGVYAGVGAGAGARYDSGVLSGSLDLGLGVGFQVNWSVNLGTVAGYAAEGFAYATEGVDAAITGAGAAVATVRDGLNDAAGAVGDAAGGVADAVGGVIDDVGGWFGW